jgi:tryptophan-rich sensory protein
MAPRLRPVAWRAPALCAALGVVLVALLGGLATQLGPWYEGLKQPPWKPSDALFGPAWTIIYALSAAAATRAWVLSRTRPGQLRVLLAFGLNGLLNVAWSVIFFSLKRPDWALGQVVVLWLSIAALITMCWRIDTLAGVMLLPYLAWVSFAAALNAAVVQLNGPF